MARKIKLRATDMELAVIRLFPIRRNLVVPNVSWGLGLHECDLLVMTKSGYLTEIEIKVSRSDLIVDSKKKHGHFNNQLKYLYFAIPERLVDCIEYIPERAGVIVVNDDCRPRIFRRPVVNPRACPLSVEDRYQLARLGALRVWGLKQKLKGLKNIRFNEKSC